MTFICWTFLQSPSIVLLKRLDRLLKQIIIRSNAEDDDQSQPKNSSVHSDKILLLFFFFAVSLIVKAERTPRSERKRRDSFGMFDGYDSCSEESTSSSSSEDSEDEVVPSIPASLPIIKNNGQVYTYPDGKAGMGQYVELLRTPWLYSLAGISSYLCGLGSLFLQQLVRCVEWLEYVMLFTQKPSASAVCPVLGVIPQIPKKLASWQDSRLVFN